MNSDPSFKKIKNLLLLRTKTSKIEFWKQKIRKSVSTVKIIEPD